MPDAQINLLDDILGAFETAKKILRLFPPLPMNIKPIHFRILNAIYCIRDDTGGSCMSDISKALGILLPNTTRFINEMVEADIVEKKVSDSDKRVVLVRTTELGEEYIRQYVLSFRSRVGDAFSKVNEGDCITMIKTIREIHKEIERAFQDYRF